VIARLKEEERGVTTFLDWIVRILRALERQGERPAAKGIDLQQRLAYLTRLDPRQARLEAVRLLESFVGSRKILLVAENLERLFCSATGMNRQEQRRFRDLIQKSPSWAILASSRTLFEDIQVREAPFYGFFQVQHLSKLDPDQSFQLVTKLARLEGHAELDRSLQSEAGHARIRALHHLIGGNPRLLVCFYQNIDEEQIRDLARPFLRMLDSLTSYYQEQFLVLSALQQKIVSLLCDRRSPASVKEIAQNCFVSHSTAASQLKRLSERGLVHSTRIGRNSFYELRDPLFRICNELRENRTCRTQLFVDFLEKTHHVEGLRKTYQGGDASDLSRSSRIGPERPFATFNAALASFRKGQFQAGLEQIRTTLATGWSKEWEEAAPLGVFGLNVFLLTEGPVPEIHRILTRQQQLFEDVALTHPYAAGLAAALLETLSRRGEDVTQDRLRQIRSAVTANLARQQQFQVACQLFDTGVRFLESQDQRILMELPIEERTLLEPILHSV